MKKHIFVEYIESGTFQASEEECSELKISAGEEVVVMKLDSFKTLSTNAKKYKEICSAILSCDNYVSLGNRIGEIVGGK